MRFQMYLTIWLRETLSYNIEEILFNLGASGTSLPFLFATLMSVCWVGLLFGWSVCHNFPPWNFYRSTCYKVYQWSHRHGHIILKFKPSDPTKHILKKGSFIPNTFLSVQWRGSVDVKIKALILQILDINAAINSKEWFTRAKGNIILQEIFRSNVKKRIFNQKELQRAIERKD